MAGITARDEAARAAFEDSLYHTGHLARMIEVSGEFVGRLDNADRGYFIAAAMEKLWERRQAVASGNDLTRQWVAALEDTAATRALWKVSISFAGVKTGEKWVKARQLRVKP
jgi:hypothetical protein